MTISSAHPAAAPRRIVFLDVDSTVLRPRTNSVEVFLAWMGGRAPEEKEPRSRESRVSVLMPLAEKRGYMYCRPRVLTAIRRLPAELDIQWLTSWMVSPDHLRQLQADLRIAEDRVRIAEIPDGVEPSRFGFRDDYRAADHWKAKTVVHALRSDPHAVALWIDDEVGQRIHALLPADVQPRLHFLRPTPWVGMLSEADLAKVHLWAKGELKELRVDRTSHY
ncbi:hypothetical protein [Microcella sp.]|uniref:hypothetical protein n=1 Tax=Microcella sp. TaxID=1913979 RepID=UPI003F706B92